MIGWEKILCLGENFAFAFAFCIRILHFEFQFPPTKNSKFFRLKYLNFPPKFLDSIVIVGADGGDNSGTSNFKPIGQTTIRHFGKD